MFDKTTGEAIFTGDGFRTDGKGEGGAGYKSAKALLSLYGLHKLILFYDHVMPLDGTYCGKIKDVEKYLKAVAQKSCQCSV